MAAVHLIIQGKVQGVFYRVSARKKAQELGLSGWVKNTKDGNVEIQAQGEPAQLQAFTEWCRQGPANAKVENVESEPTQEQPAKGFSIIH